MFRRVRVNEAVLEGLLRSHSDVLFPGLQYFDFKPAVPSRYGTRHPDGALVAPGIARWWVVEVETHQHDIDAHVAPQLEGLAEGLYGREAFRYLTRHAGFDLHEYSAVDIWEPSFLLVVDHKTQFIAETAEANGFELAELAVYRSEHSEYAFRLAGSRPRVEADVLPRGIDVVASDGGSITLLTPRGGRKLEGPSRRMILLADRELTGYLTGARDAIALPIPIDELSEVLGDSTSLRITSAGSLISTSS
jgi:hypothetical protein